MAKKTKLNSNNPKYKKASELDVQPIAKRKLVKTTENGCEVHFVWYK